MRCHSMVTSTATVIGTDAMDRELLGRFGGELMDCRRQWSRTCHRAEAK